MEPSSSRAFIERLRRERDNFYKQVAEEEDDPLLPYERYVKWLLELEQQNAHALDLELIIILEEAVRKLKDDPPYRGDARYLKLWLTYAKRVEMPDIIYVFLLKNDIGTMHAQLYEDYAISLEQQDRLREADEAYRLGISRSTRAVERLKNRHRDFQQRVSTKSTLKTARILPHIAPGEVGVHHAVSITEFYSSAVKEFILRCKALSKPTQKHSKSESPLIQDSDPYAYIKAASQTMAAPGKRPEKYCFDMSLLFKDGKEYCIEEARAKSLGLFGKKWGPPPASEPGPHQPPTAKQAHVGFNDDVNRPPTRTNQLRMNMNMTASLANEPTVTINTKEALKDVFGMYNSPEKSVKMANVALGSKHAPVRKLELIAAQPRSTLRKITELNDDENAQGPTKAFRPFVDDENKKENAIPAPAKFKPFVDENVEGNATPAPLKFKAFVDDENVGKPSRVTPGPRKGLALREIPTVTPSASQRVFQEPNAQLTNNSENHISQETQPRNVFSRVFTPQSQVEKSRSALQPKDLQERPTVFRDPQQQSNGVGNGLFGSRVFSRPPEVKPGTDTQSKDVFAVNSGMTSSMSSQPQSGSQNEPVFRRSTSAPHGLAFTPIPRERQPLTFIPQRPPEPVEPEPEIEEEVDEHDEDFESPSLLDEHGEEQEEQEEYYEDEDPYTAPMGGRLGAFEVMTPIAERTFECTTSTRVLGTPADGSGPILDRRVFHHDLDAAAAAEKLAKELREEEEQEKAREIGNAIDVESEGSSLSEEEELVERTGTLSLADAISVASSFKPANPCNPSDPQIVNTLLSLIPPEPEFYDLRTETSGKFDSLQRFASKHNSRRSSGRSASRAVGGDETFPMQLHDRNFIVTEKLGEGGFGTVFKARAVDAQVQNDDEDMDSDEDNDDDDDDNDDAFLALKVVKPRNVWEYHMLRRAHNMLPVHCRRSIVSPHALYAYKDESFLVLDLCNQGTLLDVVNRAVEAGVSQQGACLDELLVFFFTVELIKFIESMHSVGFIHGDFKIDNCLLRLEEVPGGTNAWSGMYQTTGEGGWKYKGIKMIDFGRAIDMRMFPSGQQFVADWETDVGDCFEMRENRPWTYETDYFGLAGIVYCMLFGKHFDATTVIPVPSAIPERSKISPSFKRYWQVNLWGRLFDILLNPTLVRPDMSLPLVPELASLREEMETWLSSNCNRSSNTLKGLLKKSRTICFVRKMMFMLVFSTQFG
ncbi:hypothetical protein EW145_g2217 [Phellinidium pouzarii]|uniref:Protein kinase domain-containing protein n=1 Tax=Phellinidium pouzarii TaxID=167371 RepID=A0A4S4LBP8_9AGAM|nr:hypothetical protein EW145_g2217 [Phellinidium pouzarii]